MHFTYTSELDSESLCQGDVLEKTQELQELLNDVHPHYCRDEYTHFQVLTQSCDLVLRGQACSARYITIAAVRSLDTVIRREVEKQASGKLCEFDGDLLCSDKTRERLSQFVTSLINNNSKEHFFLRAVPESGLDSDRCTFLYLSIAIKAEHYHKCLRAKIIQLDDVFQSKLGWLVGNLYSRVGTPDYWPTAISEKRDFNDLVQNLLEGQLVWVPQRIFRDVKELADQNSDEEPNASLEEVFEKADKLAEERAEQRVENLVSLIRSVPGITIEDQSKLKQRLRSKGDLKNYFGFPS